MNRIEKANQHLRNLAAAGLLVFGLLSLSGCSSGEINCLTGQKSGIQNYPDVANNQVINFQGVQLVINEKSIQVGPNEKNQLNLTVHKLFGTIAFTATLQSNINRLPLASGNRDLKIEWQCE